MVGSCTARIERLRIHRVWRRRVVVVEAVEEALRGEVVVVLGVGELEVRDEAGVEMMGRWRAYVRGGSRISMRRLWLRGWRRKWIRVCSGMNLLFERRWKCAATAIRNYGT
jgi:hypothetical protein